MTNAEIYINFIRSTELFRGLTDEEIRRALDLLNGAVIPFRPNEHIDEPADRLQRKFFGTLLQGYARLEKTDDQGNITIIAPVQPGFLLGTFDVPAGEAFPGVHIRAMTPGLLLCMDAVPLQEEIQNACLNKLALNLTSLLSLKSREMLRKIDVLSCRSLRSRILTFLNYWRSVAGSDTFEIPFDRQSLADYLCVNRSALSRELSNMKKEGILDYNKGRFIMYQKAVA